MELVNQMGIICMTFVLLLVIFVLLKELDKKEYEINKLKQRLFKIKEGGK